MFSVVINWPKICCRGGRGVIITKGSRTQLLQHSGLVCQTESSRVGAAAPSALCRAWSALCRRTLQSSICTTCTSAGGQNCTKQNRQQQNCQVALFCRQLKQQWHCQVNQTLQSWSSNLICLCRRKPSEDKDKEKRTIHSFHSNLVSAHAPSQWLIHTWVSIYLAAVLYFQWQFIRFCKNLISVPNITLVALVIRRTVNSNGGAIYTFPNPSFCLIITNFSRCFSFDLTSERHPHFQSVAVLWPASEFRRRRT